MNQLSQLLWSANGILIGGITLAIAVLVLTIIHDPPLLGESVQHLSRSPGTPSMGLPGNVAAELAHLG